MGQVTINGRELEGYGVTLLDGSYASLLTPPDMKEWVSNDNPSKNGVEYIAPTTSVVKERSVTLYFLVRGATSVEFLTRYNNFVALLQTGLNIFYFEDLGRSHTLKYESCTSFDHFGVKMCKLAVKFTEPDPTKV